jgi:hypothetical protein
VELIVRAVLINNMSLENHAGGSDLVLSLNDLPTNDLIAEAQRAALTTSQLCNAGARCARDCAVAASLHFLLRTWLSGY